VTQQELQDLELVRGIEALLEEVAVQAGGEQAVASMLTHLLEDVACVRPRRGTSQSRDGAARSASPSPAQPSSRCSGPVMSVTKPSRIGAVWRPTRGKTGSFVCSGDRQPQLQL
jgi:hypothetical protein